MNTAYLGRCGRLRIYSDREQLLLAGNPDATSKSLRKQASRRDGSGGWMVGAGCLLHCCCPQFQPVPLLYPASPFRTSGPARAASYGPCRDPTYGVRHRAISGENALGFWDRSGIVDNGRQNVPTSSRKVLGPRRLVPQVQVRTSSPTVHLLLERSRLDLKLRVA